MKQLFTLVLLFLGFVAFGQNVKLRMTPTIDGTGSDSTVTKNISGAPLTKGDTIVIYAQVNGNGNSTTRQLYFDFEYQNTALTLLSITNTGAKTNGGAQLGPVYLKTSINTLGINSLRTPIIPLLTVT